MPANDKVLIIGAGLSGLVLAQILLKNNVAFEIFERDQGLHSRKQGWAVALMESLPPLRELLPEWLVADLASNSVNVVTGEPDEIGFVNARTGELVGRIGGKPFDLDHLSQPGSFLRVSRDAFRNYLCEKVPLDVKWNKHFTHYVETADGVTAYFSDGSAVQGSVLFGADGAHSHVLDQLIGKENHHPRLSKLVPIFSECDLPPHIYGPIRKLGNAVILAVAEDLYIQIGQMSMAKDRSSTHSFWAIMPRREDPAPLSDWIQHASKDELYAFNKQMTQDLHPFVKDLVEYGGPEAIVKQARFLEFEPPTNLPNGRVSVMGDAAHSMIPFRGAGANTAILDACDLGRLLTRARGEGKDLSSVIPAYNDIMIPRGIENVRSSNAAGEMDEKQWLEIFRRPE